MLGKIIVLLLLLTAPAYAATEATSATGIPIDILFLCIGGLLMLVYGDIRRQLWLAKKEIEEIRKEGDRRTKTLIGMTAVFRLICRQLHIPWENDDE